MRIIRMISAIVIVTASFLPWFEVSLMGFDLTQISGLNLVRFLQKMDPSVLQGDGIPPYFYLSYAIPLLAAAVILKRKSTLLSFLAGALPLILIYMSMQFSKPLGFHLLSSMQYGCFLTILAAIALLTSTIFKRNSASAEVASVSESE